MEEIKQKTGKFPLKYVIEVRHQYGIRFYPCEKVSDVAEARGWSWEVIKNIDDALNIYEYKASIPHDLMKILDSGVSAVRVSTYFSEEFMEERLFDLEREAIRFIREDLNRVIVIDNMEDALFYAHKYHEHFGFEVRRAAKQIVRENEDYLPVQEFDVDVSVTLLNTFKVRAHTREAAETIALSMAEDEFSWSVDKDQWGEFEIEEVRECPQAVKE